MNSINKKIFTLVAGISIISFLGCAPSREHLRTISSLEDQLEQKESALAESEAEIHRLKTDLDEKGSELDDASRQAHELSQMAERLEQAKLERERNLQEMEDLVRDISGMRIETRADGDFIVIENEILFDPGQIELREGAKRSLKDTVIPYVQDRLNENENQLVRIDGHTDGQPIRVSPWDDNHHLSVMRAHSVMRFLSENGIPRENLFLTGYGPNQPLVEPADPEEDVEENRRVEILLLPPEDDDIQRILEDFVR